MTTSKKLEKCPSNQVGVSVLLIGGGDDVVIKTSGLLWEALPRFGEIGVMKLVPLSAASFLDLVSFQLLFFHLSSKNASEELRTLHDLREKNCKQSDDTVCVLIVPEASPEIPDSAADFILTQPVTMEKMEEILRGCSVLSEKSRKDGTSSPSSNLNSFVETAEPGSSGPQAEPGVSVQQSFSCEAKDGAQANEAQSNCGSPPLTNGDVQAFLHSLKEQKRRQQIKNCCHRLRELLPFIKCRMDTASTLELTVKYINYLKTQLPEDMMRKVVKGLEENRRGTWHKRTKATKKCSKINAVRKKPPVTPVPTNEDFVDDFIAAHILGRHIQPRKEVTQPASESAPPVVMAQSEAPAADLNSAAGTTQEQTFAPFDQTGTVDQTFNQPAQTMINQNFAPPMVWTQTCGPVPAVMMNQPFAVEAMQNPSLTLEQSNPAPVQPVTVNANFFQPANLDPAYAPPAQTLIMNQSFTPLVVLSENLASPAFLNDPCMQEPALSTVPEGVSHNYVTSWQEPVPSETLYDSGPFLPSFCMSRADYQPQSSMHESLYSTPELYGQHYSGMPAYR